MYFFGGLSVRKGGALQGPLAWLVLMNITGVQNKEIHGNSIKFGTNWT
jgi:hypothetical protein